MLLVYTSKITPRVTYVFKHIFTRVLGRQVSFTTKVDEFIAHEGAKMSYTTKQLGNEYFIRSTDLLFQSGVEDVDITVEEWDNIPYFFKHQDEDSALPYDIFAATFYLLSRYEEYLPHVKDDLGRYPVMESLAFKNNFVQIPVVDYWISRLAISLNQHLPLAKGKERTMKFQVLVEVAQAFEFKKIGFLRSVGGYLKDFFKFRLRRVFHRFKVLTGLMKDPFDTFTWLINMQRRARHKFVVFFQVGDYTSETKNIKFSKRTFHSLIKMVGDYCNLGLFTSVATVGNERILKRELQRLSSITNRTVVSTLSRKLLLKLPEDYRTLIEQDVKVDYSMGYADVVGFRAGTSLPFLFYDLDYELQTPLLLHPVCFQINAVLAPGKTVIDKVTIDTIFRHIKNSDGVLTLAFKNTSFNDVRSKNLLEEIISYENR